MSKRITLVNPYVIYECPDCRVRVATDSSDSVPDCPDCGLLGVALEFVGLGEFISAESKAEIERLRRERETLAAALMAWDGYVKTISEGGPLCFDAIEALERAEQRHREALAPLDGEKGSGGTR